MIVMGIMIYVVIIFEFMITMGLWEYVTCLVFTVCTLKLSYVACCIKTARYNAAIPCTATYAASITASTAVL